MSEGNSRRPSGTMAMPRFITSAGDSSADRLAAMHDHAGLVAG